MVRSVNRMESTKQVSKRKRKSTYTKGELNRLIDGVCHPLCTDDKRFLLLDGFLHALVERNPPETVRKFVRYNLPVIMKELKKR